MSGDIHDRPVLAQSLWLHLAMEETKQTPRLAISQFHNTIPFYNGDFQFLETNLKKLEKIDQDYFDFGHKHSDRSHHRNNLGETPCKHTVLLNSGDV